MESISKEKLEICQTVDLNIENALWTLFLKLPAWARLLFIVVKFTSFRAQEDVLKLARQKTRFLYQETWLSKMTREALLGKYRSKESIKREENYTSKLPFLWGWEFSTRECLKAQQKKSPRIRLPLGSLWWYTIKWMNQCGSHPELWNRRANQQKPIGRDEKQNWSLSEGKNKEMLAM